MAKGKRALKTAAASPVSGRGLGLALGACLLASGVAGLVLEVAWSRLLEEVTGSSASAQGVILATYMGGMALGSWLWGRRADRSKNPVRLYALLELAIGAYALALPFLIELVSGPFLRVERGLYVESASAVTALRLAFATLLLLVPTVLLGGTLPAAVRALSKDQEVRPVVARLYFLNSLGASVGAALAGFWLIPSLGLWGATGVASGLDFAAALVALLAARLFSAPSSSASTDEAAPMPAQARWALAITALCGLSALTLEVAWTRLLSLLLGASAQSFAVMLSAFLLGIALGGMAVSWRRWCITEPLWVLGWLVVIAVISTALALPLVERVGYELTLLRSSFPRTVEGYADYQKASFAACLLLMVLPTTALGAALPLAARAALGQSSSAGAAVGSAFAWNTLGTVGGAVGGALLLPVLGLRGVFFLALGALAAASGLCGLAVLERREGRSFLPFGAALLVLGVALAQPGWDYKVLAGGLFRAELDKGKEISFERFREALIQQQELRYVKDGFHATVLVADSPYDKSRTLKLNGKPDASTGDDMATQSLLGHLPLILSPRAKRAMVVGLGSGVTCADMLTHEGVEVDAVELSPEVKEAARYFEAVNGRVLENPRLRLFIDDARSFLKLTPRKYEVIVSEPSNPWTSGVGGLFGAEFYSDVARALEPQGLFVQWFHTYEIDDELFALVARTLGKEFPHVLAFRVRQADVLFIASKEPLRPEPSLMRARFTPAVRASLLRAGLPASLEGLLAMQALSAEAVRAFPGEGPVNTSRHPILEFGAPKAFFLGVRTVLLDRLDERRNTRGEGLLFHALGVPSQQAAWELVVNPKAAQLSRKKAEGPKAQLAVGTSDPGVLRAAALFTLEAEELEGSNWKETPFEESADYAAALAQHSQANATDIGLYADVLLKQRRPKEAAAAFRRAMASGAQGLPRALWLTRLAQAQALGGEHASALESLALAQKEQAPLWALAEARVAIERAKPR